MARVLPPPFLPSFLPALPPSLLSLRSFLLSLRPSLFSVFHADVNPVAFRSVPIDTLAAVRRSLSPSTSVFRSSELGELSILVQSTAGSMLLFCCVVCVLFVVLPCFYRTERVRMLVMYYC